MTHTPVMVKEVIQYLLHCGSKTILDGTVGAGGHAEAILASNTKIRLIGIDRDPTAVQIASNRLARFGERVRVVRGLFSDIQKVLEATGPVDGVLLDLGVSSMQLDAAERGFSHSSNGPLDMRMDSDGLTAEGWIERTAVNELALVLQRFGEVRRAKAIARAIKAAAERGGMNSTGELVSAVQRALGSRTAPSVLSKVFQAVRITVNSELDMLTSFLGKVLGLVARSGRLVFISYHSLEDRAIKTFFRAESAGCVCPPGVPVCICERDPAIRVLTRRVVKPSSAEIAQNSRSRSARLRAAEVL